MKPLSGITKGSFSCLPKYFVACCCLLAWEQRLKTYDILQTFGTKVMGVYPGD